MADGGDCRASPANTRTVSVELDAGMIKIIDNYCRRFGLSERGEAINELLMIGLSYSMVDPDRSEG